MYHLINTGVFIVFSPYDVSTSPPTDLHQAHPVGLVETSDGLRIRGCNYAIGSSQHKAVNALDVLLTR